MWTLSKGCESKQRRSKTIKAQKESSKKEAKKEPGKKGREVSSLKLRIIRDRFKV
jgi:hypothetical protein